MLRVKSLEIRLCQLVVERASESLCCLWIIRLEVLDLRVTSCPGPSAFLMVALGLRDSGGVSELRNLTSPRNERATCRRSDLLKGEAVQLPV